MALDQKHRSRTLYEGRDRAPARSYLKGIGYTDDDLARPIVGIANTWTETMPCNFNLRRPAEKVKEGVRAAGGTPMEFNTVAISDGITRGTERMRIVTLPLQMPPKAAPWASIDRKAVLRYHAKRPAPDSWLHPMTSCSKR